MLCIRYKLFFLIVTGLLFSAALPAQNNNAAIAAADTTGFSVNNKDGWQLFNSYVAEYTADSVDLEIILQHANNFDWSLEHCVGRIKLQRFIPQNEQSSVCNLVVSSYVLRIDKEGNCYLKLVSGIPPDQDPAVVPLKVAYRK